MYSFLAVALVASLCTSALAELVQTEPCSSTPNTACEVTNINVIPCPEAESNEPCKLRRGKTANIAFDFVPHFDDESPKTRAYWSSALMDLPFVGMDTDSCKYSNCPYTAGQANHYNYTLDIDKKFIAQRYNVKWKVWKNTDSEKKECCFIFKMRLV